MYASRNVCASHETSGNITLLHLRTGRLCRDLRPTRIFWEQLASGKNLRAALEATARILGKHYKTMEDELRDSLLDMRREHLLVLTRRSTRHDRHATAAALIEWLVWKTETGWLRRLRLERALAAPAVLADELADAQDGPATGIKVRTGARSARGRGDRPSRPVGVALVALAGCLSGVVAWTLYHRRPIGQAVGLASPRRRRRPRLRHPARRYTRR